MTVLTNIQALVNAGYGDYTIAYDAGTGSDRILLVWVTPEYLSGTEVVTGVTYNGSAMTADTQFYFYTDKPLRLFYLVAPASGSNNIVVDMSVGDRRIQVLAAYVSGFSAVSNAARATGTNTTPSVTCTSVSGETVVGFLAGDYNASQTLTASAPAVEEYDAATGYLWVGSMSEESSGSSVTIDGTISQAGGQWGIAAVSLTPVAGAGATLAGSASTSGHGTASPGISVGI
jgi:hypothetical protein